MKIFFDIDGVLADFVGGILSHYNADHETSYTHSDITKYNITESIPITSEELRKYMDFPDFWVCLDTLPLIHLANNLIFLSNHGNVHFITKRDLKYRDQTKLWLESHGLYGDLTVHSDTRSSTISKITKIADNIYDDSILFDDCPDNKNGCPEFDIQYCLVSQPWNSIP